MYCMMLCYTILYYTNNTLYYTINYELHTMMCCSVLHCNTTTSSSPITFDVAREGLRVVLCRGRLRVDRRLLLANIVHTTY